MKEEWHGDDEQEAGMMPIHQDLDRLPGGIDAEGGLAS